MAMHLTRRSFLTASAAVLVSPYPARAQTQWHEPQLLALRGMDPVAYFTAEGARPGDPRHALRWHGQIWMFATPEHLERFLADPHRHMPAYGGRCAWHMINGERMPGDPEVFAVVGGRLFLLESAAALARWQRDAPAHIRAADARWRAQKD